MDEIIAMLEVYGVDVTEDMEAGTVTVDISTVDKDVLISIIGDISNSDRPFTIDENNITIEVGDTPRPPHPPKEQGMGMPSEDGGNPGDIALDEMFQ